MKKLMKLIIVAAVAAGVGVAVLPAVDANAVNVFDQCGANADTAVCKAQGNDKASNMIQIVINILLYVLGVIAVVMIVIGGIRYTTSNGDPSSLKTARDTIIYSVVGLVVAILAYAIVNLVVGRFIAG
jgi:hypothetical protein